MLRTAVACDDPVIVCEARLLYPTKGVVRQGIAVEDLGGARVVREGDDVTIVSWSRMVHVAVLAAQTLEAQGVSAEVIDLRWLNPLDMETVTDSVGRTGRLVVVHEANRTGGFGAEVAAQAAELCFDSLIAPVQRIGFPDAPMPAAPVLQETLMPGLDTLVAVCRGLVDRSSVGRHT
jgi:pyruvate/2-oxoglutarate/acetoin dehydrogenase E1 component